MCRAARTHRPDRSGSVAALVRRDESPWSRSEPKAAQASKTKPHRERRSDLWSAGDPARALAGSVTGLALAARARRLPARIDPHRAPASVESSSHAPAIAFHATGRCARMRSIDRRAAAPVEAAVSGEPGRTLARDDTQSSASRVARGCRSRCRKRVRGQLGIFYRAKTAATSNFWRLFGDLGCEFWLGRAKFGVLAVGLRNRRSEVRILSGALRGSVERGREHNVVGDGRRAAQAGQDIEGGRRRSGRSARSLPSQNHRVAPGRRNRTRGRSRGEARHCDGRPVLEVSPPTEPSRPVRRSAWRGSSASTFRTASAC